MATPSPASAAGEESTRGALSFWESSQQSSSTLLTTMLLHDDEAEASDMNEGEVKEIFALCDLQKEWTVCEWAAGMGRLTPLIAAQCHQVYASDFVSSFCDTNRTRCAGLANVQVDCLDAATYAPAEGQAVPHGLDQVDCHFVNWLLLYLDDQRAELFLRAAIRSLKKRITRRAGRGAGADADSTEQSGWLFLHESCWERANESELFAALPPDDQSRLLATPNVITEDCQTYYRTTYWYDALFARLGLEAVQVRELEVYKATTTWSADGEIEKATESQATSAAQAAEENSYANRQMVWLLRLKN